MALSLYLETLKKVENLKEEALKDNIFIFESTCDSVNSNPWKLEILLVKKIDGLEVEAFSLVFSYKDISSIQGIINTSVFHSFSTKIIKLDDIKNKPNLATCIERQYWLLTALGLISTYDNINSSSLREIYKELILSTVKDYEKCVRQG